MYLVDTNVWLERLLNQNQAEEVGRFLDAVASEQLCMTDFALHSVCVILDRLGQPDPLLDFVDDAFAQGAMCLVRLDPEDTVLIVGAMRRFNLDFDDAYQYVAAERHDLILVSFDADFDRTERGRRTPAQVLAEMPEAPDQSEANE